MFKLLFSNYTEEINQANELMIIAINNENTQIIKSLIERKGNGFVWDDNLLHHAASQSNLDVFNLINNLKWHPTVDYNYEIKDTDPHYLTCVDENNEIPLHWSVIKGDHKIVKRLLELMLKNGLSVDYKSKVILLIFNLLKFYFFT